MQLSGVMEEKFKKTHIIEVLQLWKKFHYIFKEKQIMYCAFLLGVLGMLLCTAVFIALDNSSYPKMSKQGDQ